MIRNARVIAVEGTHGSGKTTLVHQLASRLKERHIHVGVQGDVARQSPLIEDVVLHGKGTIDLAAELHILGSQIAGEQLLARSHELIVCDKSVLSVVAYARLLFGDTLSGNDRDVFEGMMYMIRRYANRYDAVFLLTDLYDLDVTHDSHRPADADLRRRVAELLREECRAAPVELYEVPNGLELGEKAAWVLGRYERDG